jgi:hypothetical protein
MFCSPLLLVLVTALPSILAQYRTSNSGLGITTTSCSASGGFSEARHCPGPENVQVATYFLSLQNSAGQPTARCRIKITWKCGSHSTLGTPTPSLCSGAVETQLRRTPKTTNHGTCTTKGVSGTCTIPTSARIAGTSTPDFWPGPAVTQRPTAAASFSRCTARRGVGGKCVPRASRMDTRIPSRARRYPLLHRHLISGRWWYVPSRPEPFVVPVRTSLRHLRRKILRPLKACMRFCNCHRRARVGHYLGRWRTRTSWTSLSYPPMKAWDAVTVQQRLGLPR